MKLTKCILFSALFLPMAGLAQEKDKLVINELMQSNIDCIMDDYNEFPDSWVELYNSGDEAINLGDYMIGTKTKASKAWQLPNKTIAAKGYIIIYCDKEESLMHTDFRLESGKGCVVYLFKGKEIVDSLPEALKKQPAPNIAYGRKTDGADKWGYQVEPTPGAANCGNTTKDILGEPIFSEKGRVMTSSSGTISLTLSLPEGSPEGTEIRYTTDGTEPTKSSKLYSSPLTIKSSQSIRATLFCDGCLSPRSTVQSYIFLGRNMTIPVISITTDDKYFNDSKLGIFANNTSKYNKIDWRRPINFELFVAPDEKSVLNQLCETRVMGGQSREWKRKSLAVYANKRFGEKRLAYEFFPDQKPGLTNFKSIMLRNAGNDFDGLYMRDAIIQRSMAQNADLDWQAWRPAVVFINGKYHCMLNIRERSNDDNIFSNYDELEDIDMMEIAQENDKLVGELKAGTEENYEKFVAFYSEEGHTLAEYAEWMDWKEYINLMVMNLYYNNQDFPGNNIVTWRPTAEGGKWRWITKDTDFGLGLYGSQPDFNTIKWIYDHNYDPSRNWANTSEATCLFRHLMEDPDFNREFIDHCFIYMGDFLNEKAIRAIWDPMYELTKPELIKHKDEVNGGGGWWGQSSENSLNNELNNARTWLSKRNDYFTKQLADYYKLGTPIPMTINKDVEGADEASITFNGIKLSKGTFNGKFFKNRAITLEGNPEAGKIVKEWQVTINNSNMEVYEGNKLEITMPQCNNLTIKAVLDTNTGISNVNFDNNRPKDVYNLNGRKVRTGTISLEGLPKGIYIIGGKKVVKN